MTKVMEGNSMSDAEYYAALDRVNEAVLEATEQLKATCREWNEDPLKQGLPPLPDRLLRRVAHPCVLCKGGS